MNFGPAQYVPVLKVKRGEKQALQAIDESLRGRITPLLEIVQRSQAGGKTVEKHLDTAFKDLPEAVQPYRRFFLDVREIQSDGAEAAASVFDRAAGAGLNFTPVTGISRSFDVAAALNHRGNGIAIRLTREEFENGGLRRDLAAFVARHGLAHGEVDLIVDLGAVDGLVLFGVTNLAREFLGEVPDKSQWRTLTISGSSFPKSMGCVDRNSHLPVERSEWKMWRDELYANRGSMERLPTFSDCAIQHPSGVEGFNPLTMQASATIRYTLPDDWLLIKGVGTRVTPPSEQFPELATRLAYGHLRGSFQGAQHCAGCESVNAAADGRGRFGSLEAWRRLGTIHHITTVVQSLAALPWP